MLSQVFREAEHPGPDARLDCHLIATFWDVGHRSLQAAHPDEPWKECSCVWKPASHLSAPCSQSSTGSDQRRRSINTAAFNHLQHCLGFVMGILKPSIFQRSQLQKFSQERLCWELPPRTGQESLPWVYPSAQMPNIPALPPRLWTATLPANPCGPWEKSWLQWAKSLIWPSVPCVESTHSLCLLFYVRFLTSR